MHKILNKLQNNLLHVNFNVCSNKWICLRRNSLCILSFIKDNEDRFIWRSRCLQRAEDRSSWDGPYVNSFSWLSHVKIKYCTYPRKLKQNFYNCTKFLFKITRISSKNCKFRRQVFFLHFKVLGLIVMKNLGKYVWKIEQATNLSPM